MKSVCTSAVRYSLASSASPSLVAVRPGAVMSTGSPRTRSACDPRLTERQSGCAATVSSALSADQLLPPRVLQSGRNASPRGGSDYDCILIFLSVLFLRASCSENVEVLSSPPPVHRRPEKVAERSGAKLGVQRRVRRDVDASPGNKEVKKCVSPFPRSPPPQKKKKRKKKMLEVKSTAWLHARISGGRAGVLRPEKRSARLVNY